MVNILYNICAILNEHDVEYLIVGGTAVNLYGQQINIVRKTMLPGDKESDRPDIDIWISNSYKNYYQHTKFALERLDFIEYENPGTNPNYWVFEKNYDDYDLDIFAKIPHSDKKFIDCFKNKNIFDIRDIEINIIGLDDLIEIKKQGSRNKDKIDLDTLLKVKKIIDLI